MLQLQRAARHSRGAGIAGAAGRHAAHPPARKIQRGGKARAAARRACLRRVSGACDQLAAVWHGDDERGQGGLYHGALHRARAGVQHGAWQKGEEKHLALRDRRRRGALLPVL